MFYQLSNLTAYQKINQGSNQNFPTPTFREWYQEDIEMLIAQIWLETNLITSGETRYFGRWGGIFGKTLTFLLLLNYYTFVN